MNKDDIHLPCPETGCGGNIVFIGIREGIKWFKCCICEKEFPNRRIKERRR